MTSRIRGLGIAWAVRATVLLAAALLATAGGDVAAGDRPPPPVDTWIVESIFASADGTHVAACVERKETMSVRLIDTETSKEVDVPTPLIQVSAASFIDGGRTFLVSGLSVSDHHATIRSATCALRVKDGADLCRPADSATTGLREIASLCVVPSADGESLATIAADRLSIDIRRVDSGRVCTTIPLGEKLKEVLWFDGKGGLLVLLADDRLARVAAADGKVVWRTEFPRRGDGTTWLPGERKVPPPKPSVFVQPPSVTVDGSRALVAMRESDESGWKQRVVVAYDWADGAEAWREKALDDVSDEMFFVPKLRFVGLSHGEEARFYAYDTGELVGSTALEHAPHAVAFSTSSGVGWAATFRGLIFRIDAAAAKSK